MRTLLIAPAFIVVFAAALLSVTWLITDSAQTTPPRQGWMPSRPDFAMWVKNLTGAPDAPMPAAERVDEIEQN